MDADDPILGDDPLPRPGQGPSEMRTTENGAVYVVTCTCGNPCPMHGADWFTRETVSLCPSCGAAWTGSPCPKCGYVAPVPVDFQARPFEPSPAPRDEAREVSRLLDYIESLSITPAQMSRLGELIGSVRGVDAALAAAPRADPSGPMQFGRDFMLEDLWAAYRQGAKEMRELTVILTNSRRDLPVDAEIERACDAYVKLIVGRAAARAPGREP